MRPSTRAVHAALEGKGAQTVAMLVAETGLGRRTVHDALRELADLGVTESQVSLRDARQTWTRLRAGCPCDGAGTCQIRRDPTPQEGQQLARLIRDGHLPGVPS